MAKKQNKAVKEETLETILFNCRNSLRGRAAMTDKRDLLLTLVFLKFIGERFKQQKEKIRHEIVEVQGIHDTDFIELQLSRPNQYMQDGVFFPAGFCHFPKYEEEYFKQLAAERLVTVKDKRGFPHREWRKLRERNEALDCRVYARAAAWIMGADRWDEATWQRLEAQAGVETRPSAQVAASAEPATPAAPKAGTPTTPRGSVAQIA